MNDSANRRYSGAVAFYETDMHGILHNSRYVAHAEAAVDQALRGTFVDRTNTDEHPNLLLVAQVYVDFEEPLRYREPFEVFVRMEKAGGASLHFSATFISEDRTKATARLVWVNVRKTTGKSARLLPAEIAELEAVTGGCAIDSN